MRQLELIMCRDECELLKGEVEELRRHQEETRHLQLVQTQNHEIKDRESKSHADLLLETSKAEAQEAKRRIEALEAQLRSAKEEAERSKVEMERLRTQLELEGSKSRAGRPANVSFYE